MAQQETLGAYLRNLRERTDRSHVPLRHAVKSRRRKGMSREEVAKLAECSASYVEKIERGAAKNVSTDLVLALTAAVGASDHQVAHALALAGEGPRPLATKLERPTITEGQRAYVDALSPHLAGYVDLAWNVLYANNEYCRVFRGIEDYGNVLYWLLECDDAKRIMCDWFEETHLTVSWSRSLAALHSIRAEYDEVYARLEQISEFREMWELGDPALGRKDPVQRICDPDDGTEFGLTVNLWSPPSASAGWQMYLGVRA
ncbi:helix-turn-helix domain-containing protein [Dietzia sp. 179-F 9C3 NHS]|uniref:helix-turn-helix domain-containing protein n=1 Tax=Dietzia sp. 179-F 9C3 NHS TaxID=3374295 RepID=UPI00387A56AD